MGYFAAVLADNPVHFWELQDIAGSGTAADAVSTSPLALTVNGGTLGVGGPSSTDIPSAWQASGTNTGYLSAANDASFNIVGDITLEIWVYPISFSNYYWLIDKSQNGTNMPFEWRLESGSGRPGFHFGPGPTFTYGTSAPSLNFWNHMAVTRQGSTVTHYLNGQQNGVTTTANTAVSSTVPLVIGTRSGDRFSYAPSGMRYATAALYTSALSQAQLQAHLNAMPAGNTRVTQLAAETLVTPTPGTRITQLAAESLVVPTPGTRVTQLAAETLVTPTPSTRVTQAVVEVLVRNPKPSFVAYIID